MIVNSSDLREGQREQRASGGHPYCIILLLLVMLFGAPAFSDDGQTSQTDESNDTSLIRISGTVQGADGKPMKMAHVHLMEPGQSPRERQTVQLAEDGSFLLEAQPETCYALSFSAVDHIELKVPAYFEAGDQDPVVNITLAPNVHTGTAAEIKIIGSWNRMSRNKAEVMTRADDGTYSWTGEVGQDEVRYQLLGVGDNDHSVNGTMADTYKYDGGGDYYSILELESGQIVITYDPSRLPQAKTDQLPLIQWDEEHQHLNEMAIVARKVVAARADRDAAYRAKKSASEAEAGSSFRYAPLQDELKKRLEQETHPMLAGFTVLKLINVSSDMDYSRLLSDKEYQSLLERLPVSSPYWAFEPIALYMLYPKDKKEHRAMIESFLEQNHNHHVRKAALLASVQLAQISGKRSLLRKQYKRALAASKEFGGEYEYYLSHYNPEKAIVRGKKLPNFAVDLVDGGTMTQKDLKGKYVLIDFWATWCGPCVGEMPNIHEAWRLFENDGLEILSISFDKSIEDVEKYRQGKWKMPWHNAFVENGFNSEIGKAFEVRGIPKPILVNPKGKIIAVDGLRGKELITTLADVFKK